MRRRRQQAEKPELKRHYRKAGSDRARAWLKTESGSRWAYFGEWGSRDAERRFAIALELAADNRGILPDDFEQIVDDRFDEDAETRSKPDSERTVAELVAAYLEDSDRRFANRPTRRGKNTTHGDNERFGAFLVENFGAMKASQVGAAELAYCRKEFQKRRNNRGMPVTVPTVKKYLGYVGRILLWGTDDYGVDPALGAALEAQYRRVQVTSGGLRAAGSKKKVAESLVLAVAAADTTTNVCRDMLRVQLLTGMRPSEVCRLRACDLHDARAYASTIQTDYDAMGRLFGDLGFEFEGDAVEIAKEQLDGLDGCMVFIPRLQPGERGSDHKTAWKGKDREILIDELAVAVLRPYLDSREPTEFCFSPAENQTEVRLRIAEEAEYERERRRAEGERIYESSVRNRKPKASGKPTYASNYTEQTYYQLVRRACLLAAPYPEEVERQKGETDKQWRERINASPQLLRLRRDHESEFCFSPIQLRKAGLQRIREIAGLDVAAQAGGHSARVSGRHYTRHSVAAVAAAARAAAKKTA